MSNTDYVAISEGAATFDIPSHPGAYPTTVTTKATARAKQEAEHKAKIVEYETCAGVIMSIKGMIVDAVDKEWLEGIGDEILGFTNVSIVDMLDHLEARGGKLDYFEIQAIKAELDAPWDGNENVVTYFSRIERCNRQLKRGKITPDETDLINQALYFFKESGELEQGLVN